MDKLDRRIFLKIMGQGAVLACMGLSGKELSAQKVATQALKTDDPKHPDWNNWEFYYPGKYDAKDTIVINEFQGKLSKNSSNGDVDINDLINGKRSDERVESGKRTDKNIEPARGPEGPPKVTLEQMMKEVKNGCLDKNPLFTDKEYAKKTKYGNLLTFPLVVMPDFQPAMTKKEGFADYMVISDHNDTMNFYKPIYEGDTLITVTDEQRCIDITPKAGSYYRTFAMIGRGRIFNQKGELVAEGANILKESFRRHKDPSKRNIDGAHAWESPDWWTARKAHNYTDKDWDNIISMWKNEKVRGSEILYWDDVNIGDEPTPTIAGPILAEEEGDMIDDLPQWTLDVIKNIIDPKTLAKMVKNKNGIYILPEYLEKKPAPERPGNGGAVATPEVSNRDGRQVFKNEMCARWGANMLFNWMGDEGWLQRIGWRLLADPPGCSESINYNDSKTLIPSINKEMRPALFDNFPYMERVPYMKGRIANNHAMEGDAIISRAYVTDKYKKDKDYFVDLTWWCETYDNYLVQEGFATVKLPKK